MLKFKRLLSLAGGVLAVTLLASLFLVETGRADSASSWLLPSSLNLQKQADVTASPYPGTGNLDCLQDSGSPCAVSTPYGLASNSSVKINGGKSYVPVSTYVDSQQHFMAIPYSSGFISYTNGPLYGLNLYFNNNFAGAMIKSGGQFQINQPPDGKLTDQDNHLLAADTTSISFSQNGRWMILADPNVAMLRVDLQTFEVTLFGSGFNYTIGLFPNPVTAISNDGRYAVVASRDFSSFKIYDLSTCSPTASTIHGSDNCQQRDLQSLMSQQVSGYVSANGIRFISDDTLSFYANYTQNGSNQTAKYILSNGSGIVHQQDYLALGDSYISGEGAFNYQPGTDTADNTCHMSLVSYPLLLGQTLNYNSYHSVACSGAITDDVINTSDDYSGQVKSKLPRSKRDVPNISATFQPGYIDQLDFISTYQPKATTISIGGNDIGFSARLQACLGLGTCYSTYEDRLEFVREVNNKFTTLVNTYTKINNSGAADARIYVIGYPQIAKVGGDCADNVRMNSDELIFAQQAINYLDTVIQAAANKAGVVYVDTQDALNDHRLCETTPSQTAMNGVTAGNDFPDKLNGPIGRESYHPNALGHQLLEQAILQKTQNMTQPMPVANLNAAPPAETGLAILNLPQSGRAVNVTEYDQGISDDVIFKQSPTTVVINGAEHALKPATVLQATLHSTEVQLGAYTTNNLGDLSAQVVIPSTVPDGYHTLHFYGTDISGQPVDIYKVIYVATVEDTPVPQVIAPAPQLPVSVGAPAISQVLAITPGASVQVATLPETSTAIVSPSVQSDDISNPIQIDQLQTPPESRVLAAETTNPSTPSQTEVFAATDASSPKVLIIATSIGTFIVLASIAWKFR